MRVGIVSSATPLARGGYRFIGEWLAEELERRSVECEVVYVPSTDDPDSLLAQMAAFRMMRLDDHFDRVVTLRPPAHVVRHRRKIVWFIHHVRVFYDLWQVPPYCQLPDNAPYRALRRQLIEADTIALSEAHRLFTNSREVSERLQQFNGLRSEVLYPPVRRPERFRAGSYGDEIVCVCRLESHKRQHLLIEAMALTTTNVRLRICGTGINPSYVDRLRDLVVANGLCDRVAIEHRWISEDEKVEALEHALACAYVPFDEDSYGYPTIEAAHARRCTITVADAGGVPEFVSNGVNGFVVAAEAAALAETFDTLHADRELARRLGSAAADRVRALNIDWDSVIARLLA